MKNVQLGQPVKLTTAHGDLFARHVGVSMLEKAGISANGLELNDTIKEGVVLSRVIEPREESSPYLVRVQSSCLFSESFWSTDCDCASQLSAALDMIRERGGLLIYLYEEGRGIGLRRKMEAIRLQQIEGKTSSNAFACMGLGPDPRDFEISAATIKKMLGADAEIELLSNNSYKQKQLAQAGLKIKKRTGLISKTLSDTQRLYLRAKRDDLGHDIPEDV